MPRSTAGSAARATNFVAAPRPSAADARSGRLCSAQYKANSRKATITASKVHTPTSKTSGLNAYHRNRARPTPSARIMNSTTTSAAMFGAWINASSGKGRLGAIIAGWTAKLGWTVPPMNV